MVKKICLIFCLCLLCMGGVGQDQEQNTPPCYVTVIKPWVDPVEVNYIIPFDGKKIIKVTSSLANKIFYVPSIPEILAEHGYMIKDIHIWIHNHLSPNGFSDKDIIVYWYLRSYGFKGLYMLKNNRGMFYYDPGDNDVR